MPSGPPMGGFPFSITFWVKLQAIMLTRAVSSGPVAACLLHDLADTYSHQSYLELSPL